MNVHRLKNGLSVEIGQAGDAKDNYRIFITWGEKVPTIHRFMDQKECSYVGVPISGLSASKASAILSWLRLLTPEAIERENQP